MNSPPVSVVMGVYNVEPYIAAAIQSVLDQTFGDFEIVVADDGSTDGTVEQLRQFRDERLRVLELPHGGSASARNAAIQAARGDYVAFLDGDDVWQPVKLERHIALMQASPDLDLTFSSSKIIDEEGREIAAEIPHPAPGISFESLLVDNPITNGSCVVVRRQALEKSGLFDGTMPGCIDYHLWLRLSLLRRGNVAYLPDRLTLYRKRRGQITGDWRRMERAWSLLIDRMMLLAPERVQPILRPARSSWNRYLAYLSYEQGDAAQALNFLRKAIQDRPAMLAEGQVWNLAAVSAIRLLLGERGHGALRNLVRGRN